MADETWRKRDERRAEDARLERKRQRQIDDARAATHDAWVSSTPAPPRPPVGAVVDPSRALGDVHEVAGAPQAWTHLSYFEAMQQDYATVTSRAVEDQMRHVSELYRLSGQTSRTPQQADEQIAVAWAWVVARNGWRERFSAHPR